jgi:MFS family permease
MTMEFFILGPIIAGWIALAVAGATAGWRTLAVVTGLALAAIPVVAIYVPWNCKRECSEPSLGTLIVLFAILFAIFAIRAVVLFARRRQ